MNNTDKTPNIGGVVISNEVIASIAANAAKDVEGVSSFSNRPTDKVTQALNPNASPKAVKVWSLENDVKIQLFVNIKSGTNIQTVSTAIQRSVKNAVQSMTGKVVTSVNVCVQGIDFCEPTELKA
ncbi:MAG: Asp23/Gls24 family envelope stress response protein [Oscillospiraceae bacterium]